MYKAVYWKSYGNMEKFFIAYGEILKNAALNGEYRTTLLNCLNDEENK